ncbi:hypothetical protein [Rhodococcus sp. KRD162]|uniref:hypothetical protein n=1 Tax=Rhodococcus sp. KRD162 TaxID=2729725 RepID=UPI0019D1606C|nr:hypothetical protein [Rhodococcus sp. KRD162]
MTVRNLLVGVVAVFIFILGAMVGWMIDGNMTAAWVSAGGTWVGALGTIAAILWAIRTFSHQVSTDAAAERKHRGDEEELAKRVVVGESKAKSAGVETTVSISVDNLTDKLVEVESVRFGHAAMTNQDWFGSKPLTLQPNSQAWRGKFNIDSQARDAHLGTVVTYSVGGVRWQRSPEQAPRRQGT